MRIIYDDEKKIYFVEIEAGVLLGKQVVNVKISCLL